MLFSEEKFFTELLNETIPEMAEAKRLWQSGEHAAAEIIAPYVLVKICFVGDKILFQRRKIFFDFGAGNKIERADDIFAHGRNSAQTVDGTARTQIEKHRFGVVRKGVCRGNAGAAQPSRRFLQKPIALASRSHFKALSAHRG